MKTQDSLPTEAGTPDVWVDKANMEEASRLGRTFVKECKASPHRPGSFADCLLHDLCPQCIGQRESSGRFGDDPKDRESYPLWDGCLAYFPNALAEVAKVSKVGNDQHNPGEKTHWAFWKSTNHEDKVIRHMLEPDLKDKDGTYHLAKACWRVLALFESVLIQQEGRLPGPNVKMAPAEGQHATD